MNRRDVLKTGLLALVAPSMLRKSDSKEICSITGLEIGDLPPPRPIEIPKHKFNGEVDLDLSCWRPHPGWVTIAPASIVRYEYELDTMIDKYCPNKFPKLTNVNIETYFHVPEIKDDGSLRIPGIFEDIPLNVDISLVFENNMQIDFHTQEKLYYLHDVVGSPTGWIKISNQKHGDYTRTIYIYGCTDIQCYILELTDCKLSHIVMFGESNANISI